MQPGGWMLPELARHKSACSPAALMAPAALLPSAQDLGAPALPRSSRFEALGLSSRYIAVGLLKNSAVLGSFCRITTDVAKHGLAPELCISEFRLPLLSNVSLTFIVLQQAHSSPPQVSRGLPCRLCETLCITITNICTQITYISLNTFSLLEFLVLNVNCWVQSSSLKSFNIFVCNLYVRTHMCSLSSAIASIDIYTEGTT